MKLIGKSLRLSYIGVIMILNHNIRLSTQSIFSECVNVTKFFSGVVGFFRITPAFEESKQGFTTSDSQFAADVIFEAIFLFIREHQG